MANSENLEYDDWVIQYYRETPDPILALGPRIKFDAKNKHCVLNFCRSWDFIKSLNLEDSERSVTLVKDLAFNKVIKNREEFNSLFEKPQANNQGANKTNNKRRRGRGRGKRNNPVVSNVVPVVPQAPGSTGAPAAASNVPRPSQAQVQAPQPQPKSSDSGVSLVLPGEKPRQSNNKNKVSDNRLQNDIRVNGHFYKRSYLSGLAEQAAPGSVFKLEAVNSHITREFLLKALNEKWGSITTHHPLYDARPANAGAPARI
jgi:hypothetical protein